MSTPAILRTILYVILIIVFLRAIYQVWHSPFFDDKPVGRFGVLTLGFGACATMIARMGAFYIADGVSGFQVWAMLFGAGVFCMLLGSILAFLQFWYGEEN